MHSVLAIIRRWMRVAPSDFTSTDNNINADLHSAPRLLRAPSYLTL